LPSAARPDLRRGAALQASRGRRCSGRRDAKPAAKCRGCTEDLRVGTDSFRGEEGPLFCQARVEELADEYQVVEVAADPWRAAPMLLELGQRGISVLDWPQSNERVCPASQRLRDLIVEGKLRQPGDEDLHRAVALAVAKQVPRGWRIDRPGGRGARDEPIDPLVALLMATDRCLAPSREVKLLGWL
jgi:hypothetical protein